MAKFNGFQNQGQHSSLKPKPLKGPSSKIAGFSVESGVHIFSDENEHALKKSTPESSKALRTTELISAVGQIWDSANQALACLQPRAIVHSGKKNDESGHLIGSDDFQVLDLVDSTYLHVNLMSSRYVPCMVKQSLDCLRSIRDISCEPCDQQFIQNLFPHLHVSSIGYDGCSKERSRQSISSAGHDECSKERSLQSMRIPYRLMDCYRWLSQISPLEEPHISDSWVSKKIIDASEAADSVCHPHSGNEVSPLSNLETKSLELCTDTPNNRNLPSPTGDYHASISDTGVCEPNRHKSEDDDLLEKLDTGMTIQSKSCLSVTNQPHTLIAKQEHAVSGALAGVFVSLCLHPLDTVKTVVQSCRVDTMSIRCVWKSIVSERGLTGLYRGITSNITTSAPISAIYTFTYESVKGFLLPSFPKEYHSVAHCTAGACASIATSFIFTPSERIKQQMQVNSQYKNCWNAVYRIIEKGGLPSLYAGWGAVLCRNIPHSIIKFYTYESMKEMFMSSGKPTSHPSTLLTLLCGGLAGSSAALFSTPFDVVKTRLQTQKPGSMRRYDSIIGGLKDICKEEGVKGLYRGLIPRLVMYMSQGALFFTSYELFKSLISIDMPRHNPEILQNQLDLDDDSLLS